MTTDAAFTSVSSFKEVHSNIVQLTKNPVYNLIYKFKIPVNFLSNAEFISEYEDAKLWQSEVCPECLHFSHKQYFGQQGITHVKEELARKPNSKRAIISLISQDEINGSGDNPIPSFMVAQYAVDKNDLYSTFYYRALETSGFLKINLEEFRMMADEIKPQNVTSICGTIISFYAYQDVGFTNLRKNRLDYIDAPDLHFVLKDSGAELCNLLGELKRPSSVINSQGIREIHKWLVKNESRKGAVGEAIGTPFFREQISILADKIDKLATLLGAAANTIQIDKAREDIKNIVDILVSQIKKV